MTGSIGPLLAADEQFNHQVVETFATVGQSDPAWAEKVCGMAAAIDGSWQIGFGFGKYSNRNVVDAYAGIARGSEQWVVRGSRSLNSDPSTVNVGPIRYHIIEPLNCIRVVLERNDAQPIAFDITFHSAAGCVVEDREDRRDMFGYRRSTDQIRFHQTGVVSGWLEVDGQRVDIDPDHWVSTRDKSWGVRPSVGVPMTDMQPEYHEHIAQALAIWNPLLFTKPDGSRYAFHHYYLKFAGAGFLHERVQGGFENEQGKTDIVVAMTPKLEFDPATKRLQAGEFVLALADGSERTLPFEKIGETGFYLGAGHYHGGDGHYHGSWRGEFFLDGDHVPDAACPDVIARYGQFRDCLIRVTDGDAIGIGNCQTYIHGAWPEFGLSGNEPRF